MKLFVLGATGKTGSEIVNLALRRGHEDNGVRQVALRSSRLLPA